MLEGTPCVSLGWIGFNNYILYITGELYNVTTGKFICEKKPSEYSLWNNEHTQRYRVKSHHLISYMFESPRARYTSGAWANMARIGYSRYEATIMGEIYSLIYCKYLIGSISSDGYYRVGIVDDFGNQHTEILSRLIAKMFLGDPGDRTEVDHINGDKSNNSIYNLRWVYGWENVHAALQNGQRHSALTDPQIHEICQRLERGETVKSIMEAMCIPKHLVLGIKSGCHNRISQHYNIPRNKHF